MPVQEPTAAQAPSPAYTQSREDPAGYLVDVLRHLPQSSWKMVTDTVSALPAVGELLSELTPSGMAQRRIRGEPSKLASAITTLPGALYRRYVDRYGTPEARAQTVREDPVGMVSDMAALVSATRTAAGLASRGRRALAGRTPFANPNAAEADAVAFGQREGIPVSAGTATGNRFIRGTQRMVDESLGGSVVADTARQAEAQAFAATGERLAGRVHPTPVAPEQAGRAVIDAVTGKVRDASAEADLAYEALRKIERQPQHRQRVQVGMADEPYGVGEDGRPVTRIAPQYADVAMPVDMRGVKAGLRPLYRTLKRESELVPLQGGKGRMLTVLDRLMNGPDAESLSVVDQALGDLKSLARADNPALRTPGQGLAAQAVIELERAVTARASQAGPAVTDALRSGRFATRSKYAAADVLESLRDEPVQVFQQATWAKDAGIDRLRQIAQQAPGELPKVGRAYLEGLLGQATSKGGFDSADALFGKWQQLGPQTKKMLFGETSRDLDRFFLLAKKAAENPNPSGTALTVFKGAEVGSWYLAPASGITYSVTAPAMAKLLRYPPAVRLLSRGMTPVAATGRAVGVSDLAAMARTVGVELTPVRSLAPAIAGDEEP